MFLAARHRVDRRPEGAEKRGISPYAAGGSRQAPRLWTRGGPRGAEEEHSPEAPERQKEADNYKRRVDVIDQLRKGQNGPVELLNTIASTVNGTEAVWFNTMKDQGANISIEGMALSTDAVANLISNLQKTGYFKNIEIKETYQDDSVKDMQAFQFTLTCEKKS